MNMDGNLLNPTANMLHKLQISPKLIQATIDTIKAGIRLNEVEIKAKADAEAAKKEAKKKKLNEKKKKGGGMFDRTKLRGLVKKTEDEVQTYNQRTYHANEDRRFALAISGEHHRFTTRRTDTTNNKGKEEEEEEERFKYPEASPLDYSFCTLNTVEEIISEQEPPQTRRDKLPSKTEDERYKTSSFRLSYNILSNLDGFLNTLYKILEPGPFGLCWLDLSYNSFETLDEDTFSQLPNLAILYLHRNRIADMLEVIKLHVLPSLHKLTLQGNPIEREGDIYRATILYHLPNLKNLDFFAVTKSDKAMAAHLGPRYQKYWVARRSVLRSKAKEIQEQMAMSLTDKYMKDERAIEIY